VLRFRPAESAQFSPGVDTSFQVFNSNRLSLKWYLCTNSDFGGTCWSNLADGNVANVGSTYNDAITSIGD
jgi:hypothetical protein